jgi:CheY-like chemotaxis protein
VRDSLLAWGATVTEAENGREAVELAEASFFDTILLDARMPVMDGFAAAARLRGRGRVLLMLTTERPADAARCRELGVRPVLKPVRRTELLDCVRFPDASATPAPLAAEETGEFADLRILLADDAEDNRYLIRNYLKNSGCVLDECEDGASAVRRFRENRYGLVLMDVQMPVMDGYAATREMRAWEWGRSAAPVPILALTAHALKQEAQRSLDAGCNAHLTKPIYKATLLDAIRRFAVRGAEPVDAAPVREVIVDSSLEDLAPGYLENRRKDAVALSSLVERAEYSAIRVLGHNMKGSGAGYGFPELTQIGCELEQAALAGDAEAIRRLAGSLAHYLNHLNVRYE